MYCLHISTYVQVTHMWRHSNMHICNWHACRTCIAYTYSSTVEDKIKFPLCTNSPPTCERSCQQKSPTYFYLGKKLSARVFSSDPSREHAQTEQEEAAILLISTCYLLVYLHSTVACRCLLSLLHCLFSSLPVPLGAPVSYFHFRGFLD